MEPEASDFPLLTEVQFAELLQRWKQPHRAWHSVSHLAKLLSEIFRQGALLSQENQAFLRYLALFHDAIYEPLSPSNEEDSADLAGHFLANYPRLNELKAAILATKKHVSTTHLERLFNELDCAILHETQADLLDAYEKAIQFEYKAVSEDVYRRERAKFLRQAALDYSNPALSLLADRVTQA